MTTTIWKYYPYFFSLSTCFKNMKFRFLFYCHSWISSGFEINTSFVEIGHCWKCFIVHSLRWYFHFKTKIPSNFIIFNIHGREIIWILREFRVKERASSKIKDHKPTLSYSLHSIIYKRTIFVSKGLLAVKE